jgi:hypothetical protein
MATMLPATLLPKERYPVMATRIYVKHAEPMLAPITEVVLGLLASEIDKWCSNFYHLPEMRIVLDLV